MGQVLPDLIVLKLPLILQLLTNALGCCLQSFTMWSQPSFPIIHLSSPSTYH